MSPKVKLTDKDFSDEEISALELNRIFLNEKSKEVAKFINNNTMIERLKLRKLVHDKMSDEDFNVNFSSRMLSIFFILITKELKLESSNLIANFINMFIVNLLLKIANKLESPENKQRFLKNMISEITKDIYDEIE